MKRPVSNSAARGTPAAPAGVSCAGRLVATEVAR